MRSEREINIQVDEICKQVSVISRDKLLAYSTKPILMGRLRELLWVLGEDHPRTIADRIWDANGQRVDLGA